MNNPTCCPHCGGKSGTQTNVRFKAVRLYTWDGEDIDTDGYVLTSETGRRCQDCGTAVRAPKAAKPAAVGADQKEGA